MFNEHTHALLAGGELWSLHALKSFPLDVKIVFLFT